VNFGKIILYVADVEASLAFYEKAFGLKTRFIREAGYGEVQVGETTISFASFETGQRHLPEGLIAAPAAPSEVSVELALLSDRVDDDFARAVEAGAQPLQYPGLQPWGQTSSYLRTPDGTVIDLSSPVTAWA
jgi:catechol 2,3-dioxygenase-like lactoylglutathione lyase family enzyme